MGVLENQGGHRRPDRRPPGRHGLVPGHLPRGAGDRDRGHRPARDPEALGLDVPQQRWGQQITGNIAIGGAVFLLGVLPAAILIVAGVALWSSAAFLGALLVVVGALVLAIALLVSQALSGIFGVALYRYALDGEAVGGFTQEELESAVGSRRAAATRRRRRPPAPSDLRCEFDRL